MFGRLIGHTKMIKMHKRQYCYGIHSKRMFTLIEMLVVIAIISILSAMLLPALSKSVHMARQIECANKLKQFGIIFNLYFTDYNNFAPNCTWSKIFTLNYIEDDSLWKCAESPNSNDVGSTLYTTYFYTGVFYDSELFFCSYANPLHHIRVTSIKKPSSKILITETWGDTYSYGSLKHTANYINNLTTRNIHDGGANFLYADGHVDRLNLFVSEQYESVTAYPNILNYKPLKE